MAIFSVNGSALTVVSCTMIKKTPSKSAGRCAISWPPTGHMEQMEEDAEMAERKEKKRKIWQSTLYLSLSFYISPPQKLLVGDFPHDLEVDEMEEDVPKRKNRTKARVSTALTFHTLIKPSYNLQKWSRLSSQSRVWWAWGEGWVTCLSDTHAHSWIRPQFKLTACKIFWCTLLEHNLYMHVRAFHFLQPENL